jgi:hypothetical protein
MSNMKIYGIPASIILAQRISEQEEGIYALGANNHLG